MSIGIFIVLGIALVVTVAIFGHLAEKKRREEMADFAQQMGWSYRESADGAGPLHRFDQFDRGHSRRRLNTMEGTLEHDRIACSIQTGDYRYKVTSGSGKDRKTTTYNLSYLALRLPFDTPSILLRREHFFDKLSSAIGFDDIDFESEEFSRKFFVKSNDRKFTYALIEPRMMEFLLETNPSRLEIDNGYFLIVDGTRRWPPAQFRSVLAFASRFLDHWPEHLAHAARTS